MSDYESDEDGSGRGSRSCQLAAPHASRGIHIVNKGGTVNVRTRCAATMDHSKPKDDDNCPPCPPSERTCVPLTPGSKPKQSRQQKLDRILERNRVPSALAAGFFQMARRYEGGFGAASPLESNAFRIFDNLSPDVRRVLRCSVQTFESLPGSVRDRLFDPRIIQHPARAVTAELLSERVSQELSQRASLDAFGDSDCLGNPRPGLVRVSGDPETQVISIRICRIDRLRTHEFEPPLGLGDYEPEELQQVCTPEVQNGEVVLNCQIQTEPCPGRSTQGTCLRVPEVRPGDGIQVEGLNFFNVETRIRLTAKSPGTTIREVPAHVCGDIDTPAVDPATGIVIADCRVHDVISFSLPADLPAGIYSVEVIVPNNTGLPGFENEFFVSPAQFIEVVTPVDATFQIATELLRAEKETAPAFFGSDEVALRIEVIPLSADLTPGEIAEHKFPGEDDPIFGDVDSGEERSINRVIFRQGNTGGVAIAVVGFEVDDEDVFQKQITSFHDAFAEVAKSNWQAIADSLGALAGTIAAALGASGWAAAIAAAIALAFLTTVAIWAPADLIIEDAIGLSNLDLSRLTSAAFPAPAEREFTSIEGIRVTIEPLNKGAAQYRERRRYQSSDEDSDYRMTLRYNRLT